MDSRDAVLELVLSLLAEDEFRAGPSAGIVLPGYPPAPPPRPAPAPTRPDGRGAAAGRRRAALAGEESRAGPSAGIVLQGYLRDSPQMLDTVLTWLDGPGAAREHPLTIRPGKGAYWEPRSEEG